MLDKKERSFTMGTKWFKTRYTGIRYRKHPIRKNGVQFDRYYSIYYRLNGKQKEESVGWASQGWKIGDVIDLLSELKRNHRKGEGPQTLAEKRELEEFRRRQELLEKERLERENVTFSHFFNNNYYPIAKTNKKKESYRKEHGHFENWLKPVLGHIPIKDIVPLNIECVKRDLLDQNKSPRTIQYVMATFRQVWNLARRDNYVAGDSPSKKVSIPRIDNKRERFLTRREADVLLTKLKERSHQVHDIALLSLHCGLRASEIFRLKWGDVDMEHGILTIRGKGDRSRPAIMTDAVKFMLDVYGGGNPAELVFQDDNVERVRKISHTFWRCVDALGFNTGVVDSRQKVCFHTLRHTFASWHMEAGTDLFALQKLMGHSTSLMTERYSHLGQNTLVRVTRNFENAMGIEQQISAREAEDDQTKLAKSRRISL